MQIFITEYTYKALEHISNQFNSKKEALCLSGGFFMNCVFNGYLERSNLYKKIYISQSPADLGNSIGSALYVFHHILGGKRDLNTNTALFTGKPITENIEKLLNKYNLRYEIYENDNEFINNIISFLKEYKVICICDSRSEFGERALGSRSIISMPQGKDMKDRINSKIKFRESYRPFAPVCFQSDASTYFEVNSNYESFAMEKTVQVRSISEINFLP